MEQPFRRYLLAMALTALRRSALYRSASGEETAFGHEIGAGRWLPYRHQLAFQVRLNAAGKTLYRQNRRQGGKLVERH